MPRFCSVAHSWHVLQREGGLEDGVGAMIGEQEIGMLCPLVTPVASAVTKLHSGGLLFFG
jgi:hypothetical protein